PAEQWPWAGPTGILASEDPAGSHAAAYLDAARAWVIDTHRSASRCLRPWNEPTGRANCLRSFTYATVMSRQRWASPVCSAARMPAPAARAASSAREAAWPDAISVAGGVSHERAHHYLAMC